MTKAQTSPREKLEALKLEVEKAASFTLDSMLLAAETNKAYLIEANDGPENQKYYFNEIATMLQKNHRRLEKARKLLRMASNDLFAK